MKVMQVVATLGTRLMAVVHRGLLRMVVVVAVRMVRVWVVGTLLLLVSAQVLPIRFPEGAIDTILGIGRGGLGRVQLRLTMLLLRLSVLVAAILLVHIG